MNANVLQDNIIFFHAEFHAPVNVNVLDAKMASMKIYLKLKIQVKMMVFEWTLQEQNILI